MSETSAAPMTGGKPEDYWILQMQIAKTPQSDPRMNFMLRRQHVLLERHKESGNDAD